MLISSSFSLGFFFFVVTKKESIDRVCFASLGFIFIQVIFTVVTHVYVKKERRTSVEGTPVYIPPLTCIVN
jgi:hypothetical protein